MPDFTLVCPDCAGAIQHHCGAIPDATVAQLVAQNPAQLNGQARFARGFDLELQGSSSKERSTYNQGYDQEFLGFWNIYPIKRDKRKAQLAWRKSVSRLAANAGANRRTAMAQILAGAIRYRDDPNRIDEFTKYAEGWLNADGWEDEPLPPRRRKHEGVLDQSAREAMEEINAKRRGRSSGHGSAGELPG